MELRSTNRPNETQMLSHMGQPPLPGALLSEGSGGRQALQVPNVPGPAITPAAVPLLKERRPGGEASATFVGRCLVAFPKIERRLALVRPAIRVARLAPVGRGMN